MNLCFQSLIVSLLMLMCAVSGLTQTGKIAPSATPTPPIDDTERVFIEEIKLNVLALDENGDFFPNLTTDDLMITEPGCGSYG
jgi:hypothetical protein